GHRFSGSVALENALDWILGEMEADGLDDVRADPVLVPHWVRGAESARMVSPRARDLPMLGLGGSVATPAGGLKAEVIVVNSFEELESRSDEAKGRIVLFLPEWEGYGRTVAYRRDGATAAARAGAVASLIRSVTPYSQQTPHTGNMAYAEGVPRIPHAAITVEDAYLIERLIDSGERVEVELHMEARTLPDTWSRNVMAEVRGRELPDEVVVLGGHIDSWDVGTGMMDDAGGSVAAWEAVRIMKALGLRPRRTVRVVFWTNEENGLRGGNAYRDQHVEELANHVLAMESDGGVFKPTGFGFTGSDAAFRVIQEIGTLLDGIGAGSVTRGGGGADIGPIMNEGVPGMGLLVDGSRYFWYHHTDADTIDKLDAHEFALCVAAMAVHAYVVAEMPERLPR
ncbi:MAG: M20/M25/M40 family metallo-hydrolase, partial [Gemmatimonadota bacterium]|nr:M20/M25/M40 family metallo-hydrolase [Gemmatimonadota bacterium]